MMSSRFASRLVAPATLLAALLSPVLAGADPRSKSFRAEIGTYEVLVPGQPGCPLLRGTTTGRGVATRLGVVHLDAYDCVTPPQQFGGVFRFDSGSFTLIAANGDQLTGTYSGSLVPVSATQPLLAFGGDSRYSVTGGTGRFAGATGEGSLQGLLQIGTSNRLPVASGSVVFTGTLSH